MPPSPLRKWSRRVDGSALVAGASMCLIGAFVIHQALGMPLGSFSRMGSGYYPLLLGICAVGLGAAILAVEAPRPEERSGLDPSAGAWRSRIFVPLSMVAFALLLERAGLAPACVALVCVARLAAPRRALSRTLALAVATPLLAWLIFVVGLGLPFTMIEGLQ